MNEMAFKDRSEAGKLLAEKLGKFSGPHTIVYALPRGGVIVGAEIARALGAPLDLVITRKIGHPANPEFAIASVTESGEVYINKEDHSWINDSWFRRAVEEEQREARRRREVYSPGRHRTSAKGKTAIIVDDGVATGLSLLLAVQEIKKDIPWKIVVAVPVVPAEVVEKIEDMADELVAFIIDERYRGSVGAYYEDFGQVTDIEVKALLPGTQSLDLQ